MVASGITSGEMRRDSVDVRRANGRKNPKRGGMRGLGLSAQVPSDVTDDSGRSSLRVGTLRSHQPTVHSRAVFFCSQSCNIGG